MQTKLLPDGTLELLLYGDIGPWGISALDVADALAQNPAAPKICVRINSAGGSVFDAHAIYNQLARSPAPVEVDIDGLAASAASVIAMAGKEIRIAENAMMMVHDPVGATFGGADTHRARANMLDQLGTTIAQTYATRTKQSRTDVAALMKAETWMTAEEAVEQGFADKVTSAQTAPTPDPQNAFDLSLFRNTPKHLRGTTPPTQRSLAVALACSCNDSGAMPASQERSPEPATKENVMALSATILAALALSTEASEASALSAIDGLKNNASRFREVEQLTGKTGAEALGAVRGMQAAAAELPKVRAEQAKGRLDSARAEFGGLLAKGQSKPIKLTPAMAKHWQDRLDKACAPKDGAELASAPAEELVAELRGYLDVAAPVVAHQEIKEPPKPGTDPTTLTYNGKTFAQLKPRERQQLKNTDLALYNAMREAAERAGEI